MTADRPRPLVLMVLDGYGISFVEEGNAVLAAKQPVMEKLMREYPLAAVKAAGIEVGLPYGEMGNSETGHQNIGSGRVLYQSLPRLNAAIQDGSFFQNPALVQAAEHVKKNPDAALHIMGLLSNGGVHSHIDHQLALLKFAAEQGLGDRTYIHAFLDGRDSPPDSTGNFVNQLDQAMQETKAGQLVSLIGRYYAMDRNENWDRIEEAYNLLVRGKGAAYPTWQAAVQAAYKNADTKSFETAPAMLVAAKGTPPRTIRDGDSVIFYNYRPDRAWQLTAALTKPGFTEFPVETFSDLIVAAMTVYAPDLPTLVAFPEEKIEHPLGRVFAEHELKQLRIAEGEKFAHVTHFFDGGDDAKYPGAERIKIDSINTKDFSQHPRMSAEAITDRVLKEIQSAKFDVIIMNYANPDMVAHTGKYEPTVAAIDFLDGQIGRVVEAALAAGGAVLLTCDHGNAEDVVNQLTHQRSTDHTNNPVPLIFIASHVKQDPPKSPEIVNQILSNPIGVLADVAPTVLEILGLPAPEQMTAQSLLRSLG